MKVETAGGVEFACGERVRARGLDVEVEHIDERGMVVLVPCGCADTCDDCVVLVRKRFVRGESLRVKQWPFRVLAVAGRYVTLKPNERA
jgi:hypothetical protein